MQLYVWLQLHCDLVAGWVFLPAAWMWRRERSFPLEGGKGKQELVALWSAAPWGWYNFFGVCA